ncbi:MAG: DUF2182 domain-containing protein [Myxococcota bacterium]|nr:DUF2182 domain-containing protein [Myxococcota bacterium]
MRSGAHPSVVAFLVVAALAWLALVAMDHAPPPPWGGARVALTFAMWAVMMVAMMTPTVLPTLRVFARLADERRAGRLGGAAVSPAFFASGYLLAWIGFSGLATGVQWALDRGGVLSHHGALASPIPAGLLLLGAGLYQLTSLKEVCLRHCQSPLGFFLSRWREGSRGAVGMGLRHGAFCVGCCWALMLLMFVGGTMSLAWMVGLTLYVLVEKLAARLPWLSTATGAALGVAGLGLVLAGVLELAAATS